jgi:hypothetical protein
LRNREQGIGNREQGTGNREQGTGNREQGTGNGSWFVLCGLAGEAGVGAAEEFDQANEKQYQEESDEGDRQDDLISRTAGTLL